MRILFLVIFLVFSGHGAMAQWRTTNAVPVPKGVEGTTQVVENFFLNSMDKQDLKAGAIAPLNYIFGLISYDAKKLAAAGFPEPLIWPYLTSATGEDFIPVFWNQLDPETGAEYSCGVPTISVNGSTNKYSYERLMKTWSSSSSSFRYMADLIAFFVVHELVHATQANTSTKWICVDTGGKPKWLGEATANGVAHYLLSKRNPSALKQFEYHWARGERNYSGNLVFRGKEYESGSFFRYLLEATEIGGVSDLAVLNDMIRTVSSSDVMNRKRALRVIDRVVKRHSDNRPLALILAEFHTEFAASFDRYGQLMMPWLKKSFGNCIEFQLTPGVTTTRKIQANANAARCIIVRWSDFDSHVALQIYGEGEGTELGSLHLGQAYRSAIGGNAERNCYDVTKSIDYRIAEKLETKCMLRRSAQVGALAGTSLQIHQWTSDFNIKDSGVAIFVLTNAAEDASSTEAITVNFTVGTVSVKDETGKTLDARKKVSNPVREGRTLMDSRVHAMAGGPGRLLFDGRSVFGDGLDVGFLEGSPGAGEIDGAAVVVRTGEYNVILIKDKTGFPNGGAIMREPDGSFSGAITTLGMKGMPEFPSCGFKIPAELTIHEQTKEQLSFRVSGDVFNMSRETMSGQGNLCDRLRSAHVEFKAIDISLPWSANYDGTATVERAYPPMQDIYDDKEFRSGPSFGGIETSRSIVFGDDALDDLDTDETEQPSSPTSPTQSTNSSTLPPSCTCLCPGFVYPTTEPCFGRCEPVLKQCSAPNTLADTISTNDSETNIYNDLLGSRDIPDEIRDILTSDFRTMSPDTRRQIIRESVWEQTK